MEQQTPQTATELSTHTSAIRVGDTVIYHLHGKCTIVGIETKSVGGQNFPFYKVEIQKSSFSRSTKKEPAIWIPVENAHLKGLRQPANAEGIAAAWAILENREHYLSTTDAWNITQSNIEALVRQEGIVGLAKATSFLYVLKKRFFVPPSEIVKLSETVMKLLTREISDTTSETPRELEERINRAMRYKLYPDH